MYIRDNTNRNKYIRDRRLQSLPLIVGLAIELDRWQLLIKTGPRIRLWGPWVLGVCQFWSLLYGYSEFFNEAVHCIWVICISRHRQTFKTSLKLFSRIFGAYLVRFFKNSISIITRNLKLTLILVNIKKYKMICYLLLQSLVWRISSPWNSWRVWLMCCSLWWHI